MMEVKMEKLLQEAISRYNLGNPKIEFIRHNENATYKIVDGQAEYVLRIHNHKEGFNIDILGEDTYSFSA
jgi:Ser/Thr protein kinase RdoA (MazF antagonist)